MKRKEREWNKCLLDSLCGMCVNVSGNVYEFLKKERNEQNEK